MNQSRSNFLFLALTATLVLSFLLNIAFGQVAIPIKEVFKSIIGLQSDKQTWDYIIVNFRIPKAITAIVVGSALSVAGLMMQTLFRNPLAGPDVLGLSAGSGLGVAIIIMGAPLLHPLVADIFMSSIGLVIASCIGSFIVLLFVLAASKKLHDSATLLIVGLLFSSFSGAIISVLSYFSSAEELQKFLFWSLGSLGNLSTKSITILVFSVSCGLLLSLLSLKWLDGLLLGENYAKSIGVNIKKSRTIIILSASILVGSCTAFVGPIAFVGLAVPHIAKLIFQTSSHKNLFFACLLIGANLLLLCETISQMPGFDFTLPINAVTSVFGAPLVIWLIFNKKKLT
ncbi:MAG: iron ABC transporter permease [Flavobacterium sp.]|nr:iron ABC transporter permease [Flavobacterium sp.]